VILYLCKLIKQMLGVVIIIAEPN